MSGLQNKKIEVQSTSIIILFVLGTASLLVRGGAAGKDAWLACLLGTVFVGIMSVVYTSINNLYPGSDAYQVVLNIFGEIGGRVIIFLYIFYAWITIPLVLRDIGEFIRLSVLNNTPIVLTMLVIMMLSIYMLKGGINALGMWCRLFVIPLLTILLIVLIILIPSMKLINITPIGTQPFGVIFGAATDAFVFPLGECVIFLSFMISSKDMKRNYKRYCLPVIAGGLIISTIALVNVLVIGTDMASATYFPTFAVLRVAEIGFYLRRIEVLIALVFIIGTFVKVTVYLYALTKSIQKLFALSTYDILLVPVGLIVVLLSIIMFKNVKEFFEWDDEIWYYIGLLYQVILPIFVLILGLIKKKFFEARSSG